MHGPHKPVVGDLVFDETRSDPDEVGTENNEEVQDGPGGDEDKTANEEPGMRHSYGCQQDRG